MHNSRFTSFARKCAKLPPNDAIGAFVTNPLTAEQQKIVSDNMGLAIKLAREFHRSHPKTDFDDVQQNAMLGLVLAASNYDPTKNKFSTFAHKCITGQIRKPSLPGGRHTYDRHDSQGFGDDEICVDV